MAGEFGGGYTVNANISDSDQDDPFNLLARLQQARRTLSSTTNNYSLYLEVGTSEAPGIMLLLFISGLACFSGAFWVWRAQLVEGKQLTGLIVVSLLIAGVFLMGATFIQRGQNESKRVLRRKLKAELQIARELDRALGITENQLSSALTDNEMSRPQ
jgi:hypothetical protein